VPHTLKLWRHFRGLTLEDVAGRLGVQPSTVHKWEAGKTPVDLDILGLLAQIYETEAAALLFPPAQGELVRLLRRAYTVVRSASPELTEQWLQIGLAMADRSLDEPSPLPSLTGPVDGK
jgi:transcriptional regulator with XRE-family HTH domain